MSKQTRDNSIKDLVRGKEEVTGGALLSAREGRQDGALICSKRRI